MTRREPDLLTESGVLEWLYGMPSAEDEKIAAEIAGAMRVLTALDEYSTPKKWARGDYGEGWHEVLRRLRAIADNPQPADEDYYNNPFLDKASIRNGI